MNLNKKSIENIYCKFQDEKSKRIFASKLISYLTGDKQYFNNILEEFKQEVENDDAYQSLYDNLKSKNICYMFGNNGFGKLLVEMMPDVSWKGFIDSKPVRNEDMGLSVISFQDFIQKDYDGFIAVASKEYYEEMYAQLVNEGISEERIIDATALWQLTEGKKYFDLPDLVHAEHEVFVDGGCYKGLAALEFLKWAGNRSCELYCVEPDKKNQEKITKSFQKKNICNYQLIPKGLWNKKGEISFISSGNSYSHIADSEMSDYSAEQLIKTEVTSLDEEILDKKITFIKMDIEGAELEALKGARRIITEHKPKLAICVYHKPEDVWEIAEYILSLNTQYRFYLRQYLFDKDEETVLYAI